MDALPVQIIRQTVKIRDSWKPHASVFLKGCRHKQTTTLSKHLFLDLVPQMPMDRLSIVELATSQTSQHYSSFPGVLSSASDETHLGIFDASVMSHARIVAGA